MVLVEDGAALHWLRIRPVGSIEPKPRPLENAVQHLVAPFAAIALGHRRAFVASDFLDSAEAASFIEFQRAFAGAFEIEVGCDLHGLLPSQPSGLHLVSASARFDIEGGASADQQLDLKIHAGAIPGAKKIGKLDLNATIKGPLTGPKLDAAFDAGEINVAQGKLNQVTAAFSAAPDGSLSEPATRIALAGRAEATGIALADPALDRAIGPDIRLVFRAAASPAGAVAIEGLDIVAPALKANYSGLLSAAQIKGKLRLEAPDLSLFAALAGSSLKGDARLAALIDASPRTGALSAALDGRAAHFASGFSAPDRLIDGELALTGVVQALPGGGLVFHNLLASGAHASALLDGAAARAKIDLNASIDVAQAHFLDPGISGKARIVAALTGALAHLNASLKASLGDGRLMDRPTSGLALEARADDITGLIDARASLTGDVDRQPLQGSAHLAKRADGGWIAENLALSLGSAHLDGDLTLGADQLASGKLSLNAANLDDFSPLALTKLSGALQARVNLASADGRQVI